MNKNLFLTSLIMLIAPFLVCAASRELSNDVLKMKMNILGYLSLWTTGGDPTQSSDNDQDILNNKRFGSTYVVVSVNGRVARMGGKKGTHRLFARVKEAALISSWEFAGVLFSQRVSLYKGHYCEKKNLARVHINVENKTGRPAQIGLRVVIDPMLGPSDSRPFLVPGKGAVLSGTILKSEGEIPSMIYSCHKPINTQGDFILNLYGPDLVKPDKAYFAPDAYFSDDTVFDPGSKGDPRDSLAGRSAVGLVWLPRTFKAGGKDGVAFGIGVAVHRRTENQPINVMITAPVRTAGEDFWIGIVIENEDKYWDISSLLVNLEYSAKKLRLEKGKMQYNFSNLPRRGMVFAYWKFRVLESGQITPSFRISGQYRSRSLYRSFRTTSVLTK